ncbi:MAG: amidase [Hydrotalea sp.]|nr:amidase [Hydrotalea sp.]
MQQHNADDLFYLTAGQARGLLRAGAVSVTELVAQHLARARIAQDATNCFTEFFHDKAMAMAATADEAIKKSSDKKQLANLLGIPLAMKEEAKWQGSKNTSGSLLYKDVIDSETDVHIERLLSAGAIPIGKTTTPEFCLLGTTLSKLHGVTTNPWNRAMTPGGSSGGTGAALAGGAGIIGTGSDIGGSIRIPAACSGVVGYKPPHGRVPELNVYNYDPYCHVGPMARSVMDIVMMMDVMAGPHPWDQNTYPSSIDYKPLIEMVDRDDKALHSLKGTRIAFSLDLGCYDVAPDVARETNNFVAWLRELGAVVDEVDLRFSKSHNFYGEAHVGLMGGGHILSAARDHRDKLCDYSILTAEFWNELTPHDMARGNELTLQMAKDFAVATADYDMLLCPTNRIAADKADGYPQLEKTMVDGVTRTTMSFDWYMTVPFNMLSTCPVLAVPSGFADNGVPTGVQLVGKFYDELPVLRAGLAIEKNSDWFAKNKRPRL